MDNHHKIIIIAGPTASGKSQLALDVALALNGVVINADSMQVYKDTPILSAIPNVEERRTIEHRLYEIFPSSQNGTVVDWLDLAVAEIKNIWAQNKLPVVVGGTGLYIDNLINGTTPIPEVDAAVRVEVLKLIDETGIQKLHEKLAEIDVETANRLSPNDSTRVRRAYEVFVQTGIPLSKWHEKPLIKKLPRAEFVVVKIHPTKEELDARCFLRFEKMIAAGALEEVKKLKALELNKNLPAMKALGVQELMDYLDGKICLKEAIESAKLHTRQYAKRQRTWFGNKLQADIVLDECYSVDQNIISKVLSKII